MISGAVAHRTALDAAIEAAATVRGLSPEALRINGPCTSPGSRSQAEAAAGASGLIPPSGHVAGVYAKMDESVGVHKAPANVSLEGALDIQVLLSAGDEEQLNPSTTSMNCVRSFTGRGIRIWGARTLSHDPAWLHVSVRRLVLTIGRWLDATLSGLAFEPNDSGLWIRASREVTAFLDDLYQQGALPGAPAGGGVLRDVRRGHQPEGRARSGGSSSPRSASPSATPEEFLVVRLVHDDTGSPSRAPHRSWRDIDLSRAGASLNRGAENMAIDRQDPFLGYNFAVELDGITRMGFKQALGPRELDRGHGLSGGHRSQRSRSASSRGWSRILEHLAPAAASPTITRSGTGGTDVATRQDRRGATISIILRNDAGRTRRSAGTSRTAGPAKWTGPALRRDLATRSPSRRWSSRTRASRCRSGSRRAAHRASSRSRCRTAIRGRTAPCHREGVMRLSHRVRRDRAAQGPAGAGRTRAIW